MKDNVTVTRFNGGIQYAVSNSRGKVALITSSYKLAEYWAVRLKRFPALSSITVVQGHREQQRRA